MKSSDTAGFPACAPLHIVRALHFSSLISGRTKIIVDLSNITLAGRGADFRMDFEQILKYLSGDEIIRAVVVASLPPLGTKKRPQQEAFHQFLRYIGCHVNLYLCEKRLDGSIAEKEPLVDGSVRAHLYATVTDTTTDSIVLFSGDGGYTNAVKKLIAAGKQVFVIAWQGSANPALIAAATAFATVEDLRPLIARLG